MPDLLEEARWLLEQFEAISLPAHPKLYEAALVWKARYRKRKRFVQPNLAEVAAYCRERQNNVDPQAWYDHYESNGWMVGKCPMKNWQAAVRTWERSHLRGPMPKETEAQRAGRLQAETMEARERDRKAREGAAPLTDLVDGLGKVLGRRPG